MGMWQVQRFFYKEYLIASLGNTPQDIPLFSSIEQIETQVNRKVKIEGSFIADTTLFWYSLQKNKMGYYLVVPFKMKDGVILVDLGWSKAKQEVLVKHGSHVLTGYLLEFFGPSKLIVDNDIKGKTWFRLDKKEIDQYLGYSVVPFVLKVSDDQYLVGDNYFTPKKIVNNHLYYAVMWFVLSIIWIGFVVIYLKQEQIRRRVK
jgi:cytochrome oxidase assembly protein ShyY1